MKVQMLFIVQYRYLDYTTGYRPPSSCTLQRKSCLRQLIYTALLVLGIFLCSLRRAGLFAICQTMLNAPIATDTLHAKIFPHGGIYQLPEARRESETLDSLIFYKRIIGSLCDQKCLWSDNFDRSTLHDLIFCGDN